MAFASPIEGGDYSGAGQWVVCEADDGTSSSGKGAEPANDGKSDSTPPVCTYEKMEPQPPVGSEYRLGHGEDEKGAIYIRTCELTREGGTGVMKEETLVWIGDGEEPPAVDPKAVAQLAVAKMKLLGPKIASPRAAGKYTVGVPMWLWVEQGPTTYGPNTTSATAGGVTVTATAKVSSITWDLGDGTDPVTCNAPGTAYQAKYGMQESPDCGHFFRTTSTGKADGKFHGTATSTWQVTWQVNGAGENGAFTEVRESDFTVAVGELKVLD